MKTKLLLAAVLLLLATNAVSLWNLNNAIERKVLLENYYEGAEELLDTLENHYNWIDAIDNEAYYDAVSELNNK
jgi:hypothetical protein